MYAESSVTTLFSTQFSSDYHMSKAHDQYSRHIKLPSYQHKKAHHPHIVQFPTNCGKICHDKLIEVVGNDKHHIISSSFAQIITTTQVADNLKARLGDSVIVDMVPMIPSLKIEKKTRALSKTCSASSVIDLLVVFGAMPEEDLSSLQTALQSLSLTGVSVEIGPSGLQPNRENILTAQVLCNQLTAAFTYLSSLPHTTWIEKQEIFYASNRWAAPLCQSGSDKQTPLFAVNLTGKGLVVGVSDTGIDMSHCHFYDPDVSTPFDKVDTSHRKVIYYNSFADKVDDSEGHGTHVSSSVAGKSMITYGDFLKYEGNAKDAKLAFFGE